MATNSQQATSADTVPAYYKWNSTQGIRALKEASLEAENTRPMKSEDYGGAPRTAKEGTRLIIPSLCDPDDNPCDSGGRMMSFESQDDKEAMKEYYVGLGRQSGFLFSWVFDQDNLLLQINGDLPEDTARQYEAALHSIHR